MPSSAIEALPLNGRNFLELALLVPGNSPAPNFDPTKSNSVVMSSAGQTRPRRQRHDRRGRQQRRRRRRPAAERHPGGGPGVPDRDQPLHRGVRPLGVVDDQRRHEAGTISCTDRRRSSSATAAWQGLPATFDRSTGDELPFDRQQVAGSAGGPSCRARRSGSAPRVPQPGRRRAGGHPRRRQPDDHARASRRLRSTTSCSRAESTGVRPTRDSVDGPLSPASRPPTRARAASTARSARPRSGSGARTATTRSSARGRASSRPTFLNALTGSFSTFDNAIAPVTPGPQLTFPSIQDGTSFRVPQETRHNRFQFSDTVSLVRGAHTFRLGGELQRVDSLFNLGVFQQGRIELVEDFADFDHNGDGRVDDNDLLFAVTLRSATPTRPLLLPDIDNHYLAFFFQDDWRVRPDLTLNLGLRYELDTNVKNISGYDEISPLVQSIPDRRAQA